MPTFEYEATRPDGTQVRDEIAAESLKHALEHLEGQSLLVTFVSLRAEPPTTPPTAESAASIGTEEVAERLKGTFRSRPAMAEGLQAYAAEWKGGKTQRYFVDLARTVGDVRCENRGQTDTSVACDQLLSLAAQCRDDVSSPVVLDRFIRQSHHQLDQANVLLKGLRYPIFLALMAVVILVVFRFVLAPSIEQLFGDFEVVLPGLTVFFFYLCDHWLLTVVLVLLIAIAVRFAVPRLLPQALVDRIPIMGRLLRASDQAKFLRELAGLTALHVPPADAIRLASDSSRRVALRKAATKWAEAFQTATDKKAPIVDRRGEIPAAAVFALQTDDSPANKATFLLSIARTQRLRNSEAWQDLTTVSEPVAIVFVGVLIFLILAALYLPLFRLIQAIA